MSRARTSTNLLLKCQIYNSAQKMFSGHTHGRTVNNPVSAGNDSFDQLTAPRKRNLWEIIQQRVSLDDLINRRWAFRVVTLWIHVQKPLLNLNFWAQSNHNQDFSGSSNNMYRPDIERNKREPAAWKAIKFQAVSIILTLPCLSLECLPGVS